jgi:hypothetical protein
MAAISRPLGAHTGPKFSRIPTDLCGIGSSQRSGANAARPSGVVSGSTATTSTWFVPSRKRVEYGRSADIATERPSGDHVGRPGSNIRGWA